MTDHLILVDPFAHSGSGVSVYCRAASSQIGDTLSHEIFARTDGETLETFRARLADHVARHSEGRRLVVEAPETDAVTALVDKAHARLHLRLHFSRQLGQRLQGLLVDEAALAAERRELARADLVSAPSAAAVEASRLLFDLSAPTVYPNPVPAWATGPLAPGRSVTFVGRLQPLKGYSAFLECARLLPHRNFQIVGTSDHRSRLPSLPANVEWIDAAGSEGADLYREARLIVVPSLFETASMVGIEAMALGRPVVAWSHLGLSEYAREPWLTLVEPFEIEGMADAIEHAMAREAPIPDGRFAVDLNERFSEGLFATLEGRDGDFMPVRRDLHDARAVLRGLVDDDRRKRVTASTLKPWQRKMRKLMRNPGQFLRDMKILRPLWSMRVGTERASGRWFGRGGGDASHPRIGHVPAQGPIHFTQPAHEPAGVVTALMYPDAQSHAPLLDALSRLEDFRYLKAPLLHVGSFEDQGTQSVQQIADRIAPVDKARLAGLDNLFLVDPGQALVAALRSCGPRLATIVIATENCKRDYDPLVTDVLVVVGADRPIAQEDRFRRVIRVAKAEDLPHAMRRVVQERAPKSPDMPLAMVGFDGSYRSLFMANDPRDYGGIVRLPEGFDIVAPDMEHLSARVAARLTDLAVTESVYLRYRSLCDRIDEEEARSLFLSYALRDGVLFDVSA